MPDIFDTLEAEPKADIFDQLDAPPLSEFELNEPQTAPKQIQGAPVTPTPDAAQPTSKVTAWQAANTPVTRALGIPFRPIANTLVDFAGTRAGLPSHLASGMLEKASQKFPVVEAAREGEENLGESTLSPLSLATLGGGGLLAKAPSWAQRVLAGAFAAQGAVQGAESYYRMYKAAKNGDWTAAVKEAVEGTGGAAQAALGAHGAVAGVPEGLARAGQEKPPVIPPATIPPEIAAAARHLPTATAEALKVQPKTQEEPNAIPKPLQHVALTDLLDNGVDVNFAEEMNRTWSPETEQLQAAARAAEAVAKAAPEGREGDAARNDAYQKRSVADKAAARETSAGKFASSLRREKRQWERDHESEVGTPEYDKNIKEFDDMISRHEDTADEVVYHKTKRTGGQNATREGQVQKGIQSQRVGNDEGGTPAEASPGGSVPPAAGVETPPTGPQPETLRPEVSPLEQRLAQPIKGNWTKDALQYGASLDPAKPEQYEELKTLEAKYAAQLAAIPKTAENFNAISEVGNRKQWVTEARQAAEGLSERDVARETLGKDYQPPFPREPVAPTSRRIPSYTRPLDVLDALESTGKINIASAREIREGYNPPAAARKLFDFTNQSSDVATVLKGVQEHPSGEYRRLETEDDLLDAIDRAGPARQAMRNAPNAEARAAEAQVKANRGKQQTIPAGPGAATRPDLVPGGPDLPTDPGNKDVYGMAARVREERAKAGQVAPVPPGQGVAAEEMVEQGRLLLERGADPEARMAQFEKDGRVSASDMAIARAHGENLAQIARNAEEKFGTDSDEFRAAQDALNKWDTRSKAMQTQWHATGQAQQGETDLDTGSFSGLQRAYKNTTGKDFTPSEAARAEEQARKVRTADQEAKAAQDDLFKNLPKQKPAKPVAPEDPRSDGNVWKKVREYIEKGQDDYKDIIGKVATDLAMPYDEVAKAIARNKTTKRLAADVWAKQLTARRMKEQARRFLQQTAIPTLQRSLQKIPRIMFGLKVGFHGTVALGTHAPMVAFQPPFWKSYFTDFVKMYRMVNPVGNKGQAYYEMQVQSLLHRPNFITARRAGLVNDPFTYEDYNSPDMAKYVGNLSGMGNRGYFVLKILRQDMFDQHWNGLPESLKTPEVASAIADDLNHVTGVTKAMAPKGANLALFAPRLEASRGAWLALDPAKAGATFANWRNATQAQKWAAINQVKSKAWVAGTMFGLLALNQGILTATGSKQKINLTDPMKPDFLKFKAAGQDVAYGGAMISLARLPVRLAALREKGGSGKMAKLIYPDESMTSELERYVRSQLAPVAQPLADVAFKGDYENRPLPKMPLSGAALPMPKRLAARGMKPYSWTELTLDTVLPIPAEEPFKEVWSRGLGMSADDVKRYGDAFAKSLIMGATGSRLNQDTRTPSQ